jgi:hypothetical protein
MSKSDQMKKYCLSYLLLQQFLINTIIVNEFGWLENTRWKEKVEGCRGQSDRWLYKNINRNSVKFEDGGWIKLSFGVVYQYSDKQFT